MSNGQRKNNTQNIRLTDEEVSMLEELRQTLHQSKTTILTQGLRLYYQSIKAGAEPPKQAPEQSQPKQITDLQKAIARVEQGKASASPEEITAEAASVTTQTRGAEPQRITAEITAEAEQAARQAARIAYREEIARLRAASRKQAASRLKVIRKAPKG